MIVDIPYRGRVLTVTCEPLPADVAETTGELFDVLEVRDPEGFRLNRRRRDLRGLPVTLEEAFLAGFSDYRSRAV